MKVNVHAKDLRVYSVDEERIGEKLSFLDKYLLIDENTTAKVMVKKAGNKVKLEINIPSKVGMLRSEVTDFELKDAIDKSIDKLEDQIRRQKTRLSRRHRDKLSKAFVEEMAQETPEEKVAKTKRVVLEDLTADEAILQMELLGHDFFVYRDAESKMTCVMYKRQDGDYGILEVA